MNLHKKTRSSLLLQRTARIAADASQWSRLEQIAEKDEHSDAELAEAAKLLFGPSASISA
jgi:hypothetical protein